MLKFQIIYKTKRLLLLENFMEIMQIKTNPKVQSNP